MSGLWHGANFTYLIWGGLNGVYLICASITKSYREKLNLNIGLNKFPVLLKTSQILITFLLIAFTWIFFRANTVSDAFIIIKKIPQFNGPLFIENPSKMIFSFMGVGILLLVEFKREFYKGNFSFYNHPNWLIRNLTYATLVVLIILTGVFDGGQFIYFQF